MREIFTLFIFTAILSSASYGKKIDTRPPLKNQNLARSGLRDTLKTDTSKKKPAINLQTAKPKNSNIVQELYPSASLGQYLKGHAAGLYVQEPSGEPGTYQYLLIHGTSTTMSSYADLVKSQPLVVIDGLPIISNESPIAYDIQQYSFNRIGPATNLLAGINLEEIESIEVLKDLSLTGIYGPKAANGVINIKMKRSQIQPLVTFNASTGVVTRPSVTTINGNFENNFRQAFYNRYANPAQLSGYPAYLKDSLNSKYFGPSNWTDSYYRNAIIYDVNASVTGGSRKANFKFSLGNQSNSGNADATSLDRYNTAFVVNIFPTNWLSVTANINAAKLVRNRNRSNRDRLAEVRYLPELNQAPAPNLSSYQSFLSEYAKSIDDNGNSIVNGFLNIGLDLGKVKFNSRFGTSYNEGTRDIFYPSTLLDNNNYVSNYFGYSQRLTVDNTLNYGTSWKGTHQFDLIVGQSLQWDLDRYNYAYAYRGPNDFLKVNLLNNSNDLLPTTYNSQLISKYLDGTKNTMLSFFAKGTYSYKGIYSASLTLRADGSSNEQPTSQWYYSPILSAGWDLKKDKLDNIKMLSALNLRASYGRMGVAEINDRYAAGPLYSADIGWTGEPRIPSFLTTTTLSRPYRYGYTGYDIPWTYTEQFSFGFDFGLWKNRLKGSIDLYSNSTKNQLLALPEGSEYGYSQIYYSGMNINNSGIDLNLNGDIITSPKGFKWSAGINVNINRNKLNALPKGLQSVIIDDRKFQVGSSVDQYWLLKNNGIYLSDDEVPVNPKTGQVMTYKGIALKAGDPKWEDTNGDYRIDDNDKSLRGHILPVISGGLTNTFRYGDWDLTADLYFNIGREIMNQNMANRFNFINQETANSINSVKEITFWQKPGNYDLYPRYNPWSQVVPYRVEQDLFLENASFLKLRNVSLGWNMTSMLNKKARKKGFKNVYLYIAASNVFTITPYTGQDPELVDYTGYDTGYGLPLPRTFTGGIKVNF